MTNIEKNVLRRVHTIRILRPIVSPGTLAVLVFTVALWGIGREVWVAQVFANGPQDFFGHFSYLVYAFSATDIFVQSLSLLTLAALIYCAREFVRAFSFVFTPSRV